MNYHEMLGAPEAGRQQVGNFIVELGPKVKVTLTSSEVAHTAWQDGQKRLARLNDIVPRNEKPGMLEKMLQSPHQAVRVLGLVGTAATFLSPVMKLQHMEATLNAQRGVDEAWAIARYKSLERKVTQSGVDAEHTIEIAPIAVPTQGWEEIEYAGRSTPTIALETRLRQIQDGRDYGQQINPCAVAYNMLGDVMNQPEVLARRLEALYPALADVSNMQQRQLEEEVPDPAANYGVMQGLALLVDRYDTEIAAETEGARTLWQTPGVTEG